MKVMGIDQSYRSSGIVILEDDEIIHCEKYATVTEDDVYNRAHQLATHISLMYSKYQPDRVAFEGLSFGSTGNVTRDLGGLLFTAILFLRHKHGADPQVIPPPTVKKIATGKGNSKKEAVIDALPSKVRAEFDALGVKKTTGLADLADAYWIAKAVAKM